MTSNYEYECERFECLFVFGLARYMLNLIGAGFVVKLIGLVFCKFKNFTLICDISYLGLLFGMLLLRFAGGW